MFDFYKLLIFKVFLHSFGFLFACFFSAFWKEFFGMRILSCSGERKFSNKFFLLMFFFIKQRGEKIVSLREDEKISIGEQPFEAFLQLVEIGWLPSASQCSPGCKTIFSAGFFRSRRVAKLFASPSCETFTANSGRKR